MLKARKCGALGGAIVAARRYSEYAQAYNLYDQARVFNCLATLNDGYGFRNGLPYNIADYHSIQQCENGMTMITVRLFLSFVLHNVHFLSQ